MFYIILFGALAVLLIVAGLTAQARNRRQSNGNSPHPTSRATRRSRKSQRAQSRRDRRRRR